MSIFLTGSTGYLGSYVAAELLKDHPESLLLLVRAASREEAEKKLWKAFQLHMSFKEFFAFLRNRVEVFLGDLTQPQFGLDPSVYKSLLRKTSSIIHCAASLNRKSAKTCFNVNLKGTLEVIKLARAAHENHGIRRVSEVSTVAVAGKRQDELVAETDMVDWNRSDYDSYARTKKFCEHMLHELLPDIPVTVFRPSIILGDSRFSETTQFDMVRAFVFLAQMPILPFRADCRADIVPADFVSHAIVTIHQKETSEHGAYNLSSGTSSLTYKDIVKTLAESGVGRKPIFCPWLNAPFRILMNLLAATPRAWGLSFPASLMKVFLPYLTFNTVFDNTRITGALDTDPTSFRVYAVDLFRFAQWTRMKFPYKPWPEKVPSEPETKVA